MKKILRFKKLIAKILIGLIVFSGLSFFGLSLSTKAEIATDDLKVYVGYMGLEHSDYYLAGDFTWQEMYKNIDYNYVSYSYFNGSSEDNYFDHNIIVCSAGGWYIKDILAYANIHFADVDNIQFYVEDAKSIWVAFDKTSLFKTRYYFPDMAESRETLRDDTGSIYGYSFDGCWGTEVEVEPMLAYESSWNKYGPEWADSPENYENMSASDRFRLLFGQTEPTESMTHDSAQYVSAIYVRLNGTPSFTKGLDKNGNYTDQQQIEMNSELGSHTVTAYVETGTNDVSGSISTAILDELESQITYSSTDEKVMTITGVEYEPVEGYSDLVAVKISYDVIGKGKASITADFGAIQNSDGSAKQTVNFGDSVYGENSSVDTDKAQKETEEEKTTDKEKTTKEKTDKEKETKATSEASNDTGGGTHISGDDSENNNGNSNDGNNSATGNLGNGTESETEQIAMVDDGAEVKSSKSTGIYTISNDTKEKLDALGKAASTVLESDTDVKEVEVNDSTEQNENKQKMLLLLVGLGAVCVAAIGGAWQVVSYKARLKKNYSGEAKEKKYKRWMEKKLKREE